MFSMECSLACMLGIYSSADHVMMLACVWGRRYGCHISILNVFYLLGWCWRGVFFNAFYLFIYLVRGIEDGWMDGWMDEWRTISTNMYSNTLAIGEKEGGGFHVIFFVFVFCAVFISCVFFFFFLR